MLLLTHGLGPFNQEKLIKRPDEKFRQGFNGTQCKGIKKQVTVSFPLLTPWVRGRGDRVPCMGGGVACTICPPPPRGCCTQGPRSRPCFCSNTSEGAVGVFLVFLYLFVHNWPQLRMHSYFPHSFFVFCCSRGGDVCPSASCSKGPRTLVPGCLSVAVKTDVSVEGQECAQKQGTEAGSIDCQQRYQSNSMGKDSLFSKQHWKKPDNMWEGNEGPLLLSTIHPSLQNCRKLISVVYKSPSL